MKVVRICLSVACICFAIAWSAIALFVVQILPPAEPYSSIGGLVTVGGHLIAFGALIIAAISGISALVRHPEDCSLSDYSLIVGSVILCGLFSYRILNFPPVY